MIASFKTFSLVIVALGLVTANAQPGGRPGGPMGGPPRGTQFPKSLAKLFGDNSMFSAELENQVKSARTGETMIMPGKTAFNDGKSRFEMDMTEIKGGPPGQADQMKAIGMDKVIMISRPDKKISYQILPGMQAYVESPIQDPEVEKPLSDFKLETTKLGEETVDGHPCQKNKAVVTDGNDRKREFTVWNATDLKGFPIKIETVEPNGTMTLLFKKVNLGKPADSQFDPPSDYKKYDNMQALRMDQMMKRNGMPGGMPPGGMPPGGTPPGGAPPGGGAPPATPRQ